MRLEFKFGGVFDNVIILGIVFFFLKNLLKIRLKFFKFNEFMLQLLFCFGDKGGVGSNLNFFYIFLFGRELGEMVFGLFL